jgi:two-component system, NtrC family, sensor kinase
MKNFAYPGSDTKLLTDINKALEDTINISRNEWKYVAEIKTHFNGNLSSVPCYPGELNQVFLNVIINAADAIEEKTGQSSSQKGIIDISTDIVDKLAVITIKGSGIGISKENINKIFDPFFTTIKVGKGSGQGLAIACDIIVNKHRGND